MQANWRKAAAVAAVGCLGFGLCSAPAHAAKLDADQCVSLKTEKTQLITDGVASDMERGPAWARDNLDAIHLSRIKRFLTVEDMIEFRCEGVQEATYEANNTVPLPVRNPRARTVALAKQPAQPAETGQGDASEPTPPVTQVAVTANAASAAPAEKTPAEIPATSAAVTGGPSIPLPVRAAIAPAQTTPAPAAPAAATAPAAPEKAEEKQEKKVADTPLPERAEAPAAATPAPDTTTVSDSSVPLPTRAKKNSRETAAPPVPALPQVTVGGVPLPSRSHRALAAAWPAAIGNPPVPMPAHRPKR